MPEVWRRNAVGIWTVMFISNLHSGGHILFPDSQPAFQIPVELSNLRWNRYLGFVFPGEHIRSLQTVPRDAQHSRFIGVNAPLPIEFIGGTQRHPARRLGRYRPAFPPRPGGSCQLFIAEPLPPAPRTAGGADAPLRTHKPSR